MPAPIALFVDRKPGEPIRRLTGLGRALVALQILLAAALLAAP